MMGSSSFGTIVLVGLFVVFHLFMHRGRGGHGCGGGGHHGHRGPSHETDETETREAMGSREPTHQRAARPQNGGWD